MNQGLPTRCVIVMTSLLASLLAAAPVTGARPNVILIMADDMGFECLGCNGSASYETPQLDRLAANGIRFSHCYSQPLCTPSRVKIMTGKYNFRNYVDFGYMTPEEITFGHLFQRAGYRTCIVGKWQLNGIYHDLPRHTDSRRPLEAGFDEACLWQVTRDKSQGERYADPLVEENGKMLGEVSGEYGPDYFAEYLCDFMERHRQQPFFVYYPMVLTHEPFVPTPDSPAWQSGDRHRKDLQYFGDMVAYCDKIVGRIDAKLAELGLRENTLLLFTADNGTDRRITSSMRDGTVVHGGKNLTTDAGTHVPLVASWPGTAPTGVTNSDLIDFSDFFPTLAELVGAPLAAGDADGVSFLPQLRGQPGHPREFVFCHFDPRWGEDGGDVVRFARNKQYKLYARGDLYHVASDALEQHPLTPGPLAAHAARRQLQAALDSMPAVQPRWVGSADP